MPIYQKTLSGEDQLGNVPLSTAAGKTHWNKWPRRMACGRALNPNTPLTHGLEEWCEDCLAQLGAWFGGIFVLQVLDGIAIESCGLEHTRFSSWSKALDGLKQARKRAFGLRKSLGRVPRFRLSIDLSQVDPKRLGQHVPLGRGSDSALLEQYGEEHLP